MLFDLYEFSNLYAIIIKVSFCQTHFFIEFLQGSVHQGGEHAVLRRMDRVFLFRTPGTHQQQADNQRKDYKYFQWSFPGDTLLSF